MKRFDFKRFCREHSIRVITEGHKHTQGGWMNFPCPFCAGNEGYHLGWDERVDRFNCWRCGFHKHTEVIASLLRIGESEAVKVWKQYQGRPVKRSELKIESKADRGRVVHLPAGATDLKAIHRRYLKGRKFDPKKLAEIWGLKGTNYTGPYKFRVIAPIHLDGELISYQGRDITDRSELKYKACRQENERVPHQDSLYGIDKVSGDSVVIVEGITDVWRLGPGAVATFGIDFTKAQVLLMKRFKRRFVFFDTADSQARAQARLLAREISAWKGEVEIVEADYADPGSMPQKKADRLMKELLS